LNDQCNRAWRTEPGFRGQARRWLRGKVVKGAKPADLPIEQPVKFELVVNLKPARGIGLTLDRSFLLRADDLIE
jgi:hypothetical protein